MGLINLRSLHKAVFCVLIRETANFPVKQRKNNPKQSRNLPKEVQW